MTLEQLYEENYPIVYGYLLSLCRDDGWAEDLAAETFLKAIQKIHTYDESRKPSTWLCTIARNLFLNEQKRRKRTVPLDESVLASTFSLEDRYIDREQVLQIYRTAKALNEPYGQVFFMRLSGLSFRDIGDALGQRENWARVTYFRAKQRILGEMEESK